MDQQKIGMVLKQLRTEKHVTQQQLAETLGVSNRTISRWETGHNMPDFDLLLELAKYYGVGVEAILNGELITAGTQKTSDDVMHAVAAYTNEEKTALRKRFHTLCWIGTAGMLCYVIFDVIGLSKQFPYNVIGSFGLGIAWGMLICGILFTSRYGEKIRAAKKKLIAKLRGKSDISFEK